MKIPKIESYDFWLSNILLNVFNHMCFETKNDMHAKISFSVSLYDWRNDF